MASYLEIAEKALRNYRRLREAETRRPTGTQGAKAARLLEERGWVAIRSSVLEGEIVLLTRDEQVEIPPRFAGCVRFVQAEFALVAGMCPDTLKAAYAAKRIFKGLLIAHGEASDTPAQASLQPPLCQTR